MYSIAIVLLIYKLCLLLNDSNAEGLHYVELNIYLKIKIHVTMCLYMTSVTLDKTQFPEISKYSCFVQQIHSYKLAGHLVLVPSSAIISFPGGQPFT